MHGGIVLDIHGCSTYQLVARFLNHQHVERFRPLVTPSQIMGQNVRSEAGVPNPWSQISTLILEILHRLVSRLSQLFRVFCTSRLGGATFPHQSYCLICLTWFTITRWPDKGTHRPDPMRGAQQRMVETWPTRPRPRYFFLG